IQQDKSAEVMERVHRGEKSNKPDMPGMDMHDRPGMQHPKWEQPMKTKRTIALPFALLLATGTGAQEHQHQMPGMQMPAQQQQHPMPGMQIPQQKEPRKQNQQAPQPGPSGAPGMQTPQGALPTIEQRQQANPQPEMKMEH